MTVLINEVPAIEQHWDVCVKYEGFSIRSEFDHNPRLDELDHLKAEMYKLVEHIDETTDDTCDEDDDELVYQDSIFVDHEIDPVDDEFIASLY